MAELTTIPTPAIEIDDDLYWMLNASSFFGPVIVAGQTFFFGGKDSNVWALYSPDGGPDWDVVPGQDTTNQPYWTVTEGAFAYPKFVFRSRLDTTFHFHTFNCSTLAWSSGPFSPFTPGGTYTLMSRFVYLDDSNYIIVYGDNEYCYYHFNGGAATDIFAHDTAYYFEVTAFAVDAARRTHLFIIRTPFATGVNVLYYAQISAAGSVTTPVPVHSLESPPGASLDRFGIRAVYNAGTDEIICLVKTKHASGPGEYGLYRGTPSSSTAPTFTYEAVIPPGTPPVHNALLLVDQNGDYASVQVAATYGESPFGLWATAIDVYTKVEGVWTPVQLIETATAVPGSGILPEGWVWDGFLDVFASRYPDGTLAFVLGGEAFDDAGNYPCNFVGIYVWQPGGPPPAAGVGYSYLGRESRAGIEIGPYSVLAYAGN